MNHPMMISGLSGYISLASRPIQISLSLLPLLELQFYQEFIEFLLSHSVCLMLGIMRL